jgi:hypothetical protein
VRPPRRENAPRELGAVVLVIGLFAFLGCGSERGPDTQTAFSFRAPASAPPAGRALPLRTVLEANGLSLQADCMRASGAPVFEAAASTMVPGASLGIHYGLQDGETPTVVIRNLRALTAQRGEPGVLGPIGPEDAAAGTMSFLRRDGGSVTVTFVAMTGAPNADCAFGGSASVHSADG